MNRLSITFLAVVFAMGMPMAAMAMNHMEHPDMDKSMAAEKMQHGDMEHADQGMHKGSAESMEHAKEMSHDMHMGDMASNDEFVEIGKDTQNGVVATVKVKTYDAETKATMEKMGMHATHHVMVFFTDEKTGEPVSGKAALKVKDQEGKPAMMMQMGNGFGTDVTLEEGMHSLEVGTKLEDGSKRQFTVMFHNM